MQINPDDDMSITCLHSTKGDNQSILLKRSFNDLKYIEDYIIAFVFLAASWCGHARADERISEELGRKER